MSDLGDFRLNETPGPVLPEPPERRGLWIVVIVALAVVILVSGYLVWRRSSARPVQPAVVQRQTPPPAPATAIQREPGENIPLPPLDETDALVRQLVAKLSTHPEVAAWLTTDKLIRNFTVVVLNIAEKHTPVTHLRALALNAPFTTAEESGSETISSASYRRYDPYADAFSGLDARGSARLYATLKPRIQDAYKDLGFPEGDFDDVLKRAIVELLQTPVIDKPITVHRTAVSYKYDDPKLEALTPAQKQLLRMGPRNVRLIQAKLREMAPYLGITLNP
jgi:hypothetical protein